MWVTKNWLVAIKATYVNHAKRGEDESLLLYSHLTLCSNSILRLSIVTVKRPPVFFMSPTLPPVHYLDLCYVVHLFRTEGVISNMRFNVHSQGCVQYV